MKKQKIVHWAIDVISYRYFSPKVSHLPNHLQRHQIHYLYFVCFRCSSCASWGKHTYITWPLTGYYTVPTLHRNPRRRWMVVDGMPRGATAALAGGFRSVGVTVQMSFPVFTRQLTHCKLPTYHLHRAEDTLSWQWGKGGKLFKQKQYSLNHVAAVVWPIALARPCGWQLYLYLRCTERVLSWNRDGH